MPRKKASFEENIEQLEKIVQLLENGDASLDDIMKNYSAGMELSKKCMEELTRVEKEMDILIRQQNGKIVEKELQIEGE